MADTSPGGGIEQKIKLLLDKSGRAQLINDAKDLGRKAAQGFSDAFKLVNIPDIQPLDPKKVKNILKSYGKDVEGAKDQVKKLEMEQQKANTTLTATGRLLQKLGVDVKASSMGYQGLTANIRNVGTSLPAAATSMRGFLNQLGGSGMQILKSFAGQLGIAFSVYRLVNFAKSAVTTAGESQAAWARLSSTLSDFGIPLSKVQGDIEAVVVSQSKLGIKQQDTVEVMATLMQLTGDYGKSLKATVVVTDLMIARHMTMEQAARAVGRAIDGDTMLLSRQGIYLDKNRDAIEQLTERMRGELAARATTLAGKIAIVSSSFNDLKIAIGEALTSSTTGNFTEQLVDGLQEAVKWVKANQEDFQAFTEIVVMIGKAAFYAFRGLITSLKLVEAGIGILTNGFVALYEGANYAGAKIEVAMLTAANAVQKGWDYVFRQHHTGIEKMIKDAQHAADEAKKGMKRINEDTGQALDNLFTPAATPSGPKAPDFALGTAGKIQAKVQTKTHADIRQLGDIAMHGREAASVAANEELNKKLQEQEKIVSDLSADDEMRARNAGAIKDAEQNIADIKKIQLAYEKKMNDNAAQRRHDAEVLQDIERLGRIAREAKDPEDQAKAMEGLVRIQKNLTAEQSHTVKYSERYFLLQNQIDQIEHQRDERTQRQDKEFTDKVNKLHDQIMLHVDEAGAVQTLTDMMADLNKQLAAATNKTDKLRIAQRQRQVEQAMHTQDEMRQARVTQDELDLQDPAKKKSAERDLLSISTALTKEIFNRKTLNMDVSDLEKEQLAIQQALAAVQHTSAADLRKELSDAKQLAKTYDGRKAAAELYEKVIEDITAQLANTVGMSDQEIAHLKVLLGIAQQGLLRVGHIASGLKDDWKEMWEEMGQSFIDNVSSRIAESWTRAAELMLGDLKDIKRAATTAFQGMGKAFAAEIKSIATLRAKQHIAEAVSEGAEALKALAEHRWSDAAMHAKDVGHQLLAAAKWNLLAGAAGNIGGAGVSGNSAAGGGGNSGTVADKTNPTGPVIYLKVDGMDPNNPRHQQAAGVAVQKWQETAQGATVTLGGNK